MAGWARWSSALDCPFLSPLTHPHARTWQDYWGGTAAKVAYGNTMNTFQCLRIASPEAAAVVAAFQAELPSDVAGLELVTTAVSRLVLRHTADYGTSQLEIELGGPRTRQHRRGYFVVWPATLGATYYYEATAVAPPTLAGALFPGSDGRPTAPSSAVEVVLRAAGTFGSDLKLVLTELRIRPAEGAASPSDTVVEAAEHPGLNVMSFNVWNTNPPHWLYAGEAREKKYHERMDLLAEVVKATAPAIIGLQEVRYDQSLGGPRCI